MVNSADTDIYRIFELNNGILYEIAFVKSKDSTKFYLESSNLHNTDTNVSYFAQKIKVEN